MGHEIASNWRLIPHRMRLVGSKNEDGTVSIRPGVSKLRYPLNGNGNGRSHEDPLKAPILTEITAIGDNGNGNGNGKKETLVTKTSDVVYCATD